jgi:hypothetical protein
LRAEQPSARDLFEPVRTRRTRTQTRTSVTQIEEPAVIATNADLAHRCALCAHLSGPALLRDAARWPGSGIDAIARLFVRGVADTLPPEGSGATPDHVLEAQLALSNRSVRRARLAAAAVVVASMQRRGPAGRGPTLYTVNRAAACA